MAAMSRDVAGAQAEPLVHPGASRILHRSSGERSCIRHDGEFSRSTTRSRRAQLQRSRRTMVDLENSNHPFLTHRRRDRSGPNPADLYRASGVGAVAADGVACRLVASASGREGAWASPGSCDRAHRSGGTNAPGQEVVENALVLETELGKSAFPCRNGRIRRTDYCDDFILDGDAGHREHQF